MTPSDIPEPDESPELEEKFDLERSNLSHLQHLKELKSSFLGFIEQQIKGKLEREISVLVKASDYPWINASIKQTAGHWTLFGSVYISINKFPVTYAGAIYEVDFIICLLEDGNRISNIASDEMILFYGASPSLTDPESFEIWLKKQIIQAWNG